MSGSLDPTLHRLDDCGCCAGLARATPAAVANRPGLSAIAYRVGSHARFKGSMLAALARLAPGLTTRDDDDFSIALLDAWASVADVLTFYQERLANESYLRTASERLSVRQLARLIGYEPAPGVAAGTYLAFQVDKTAKTATVATGTRVQNIPAQGKQPQTFETIEAIAARADWNALQPRLTKPYVFPKDGKLPETFYLAGVDAGLRAGDAVLISPGASETPQFFRIADVTPEPQQKRTEIQLKRPPAVVGLPLQTIIGTIQVPGLQQLAWSAVSWQLMSSSTFIGADLSAMAMIQGFKLANVFANLEAAKEPPQGLLAFRTRAAVFGHNAPAWHSLPVSQRFGERNPNPSAKAGKKVIAGPYASASSWVDSLTLDSFPGASGAPKGQAYIFLDTTYPEIAKDSWIVLQDGGAWKNYRVKDVVEVSLSKFTLNAKVTRLSVEDKDLSKFGIRSTTVFARSEVLPLAPVPIAKAVAGATIALDGWVDGLAAGQSLIICGELAADRGNSACEHGTIDEIDQFFTIEGTGFTSIKLRKDLANTYVRDTVKINANVAKATHGETVAQEALGSGDGRRSFQSFPLKRTPLTHTSAATPSGAESTLEVRVDGVRWYEAGNLAQLGSEDRHYLARTDEAGTTRVIFGDGRRGARLPSAPTGLENVSARYRFGIGSDGNVDAGSITLLAKRPPGVSGVENPLAATGGADPESRDTARRNAPLKVLTLDRIVSLRDFEDFARAFAGVSKALATWTWNGESRGVFVTVAGPGGNEIKTGGDTHKKLLRAMREAGDPYISLRVGSFRPAFFRFEANVRVDPDYESEKVLAAIEKAARARFSFDVRAFGQPVNLGEVAALIQRVTGVEAAHVTLLYRGDTPRLDSPLPAALPQAGGAGTTVLGAELLTLDPRPLKLGVLS